MSNGWNMHPLGALLADDGLSYGIVQPGQDDPSGVPILRVNNLRHGAVSVTDPLRVSPAIESKYQRSRLRGGEVLLSVVGTVGETAIAPKELSGWNVARAIAVIRPSGVESAWLRLCLMSEPAKRCMHIWKTTTVQETLNLRDIRRLPILIPPAADRRSITALIETLDAKIVANDRTASTCHELGQAISAHAHNAGFLTLLSDIADITMGSSPPSLSYNEMGAGLPFYQGIRDFGERFPRRRVWCTSPVRTAAPGSILVSVRAPVGELNIAREQCCIGRGVAAATSRYGTPSVLFHELAGSSEIWRPYEAEGTVFGSIGKDQLRKLSIRSLAKPEAESLEIRLSALDRKVEELFMESQVLRHLRDTLLPRLMSGEIRVREAEKMIEDAT